MSGPFRKKAKALVEKIRSHPAESFVTQETVIDLTFHVETLLREVAALEAKAPVQPGEEYLTVARLNAIIEAIGDPDLARFFVNRVRVGMGQEPAKPAQVIGRA